MNHLFVLLVFSLVAALAAVALWSRKRTSRRSEWNTLVARLARIDRDRLAQIAAAQEHHEETAGAEYTQAEEQSRLWFREVGLQGLEDMQNNCAVMIDMAHYIQSRYPEAVVVAEQLRLTARQIEWHLDRIRLASKAGHVEACFAEYGNRAIRLYCGMTETLKLLYEGVGVPERAQVQALL
jgi:hypothetical protein